jgi:sterol desaturase/sphingolipid hydroxylase (fatty acid hydroxylase superfamily)
MEFGPDAAPLVYGGAYFGTIALIAAAEAAAPRRALHAPLRARWFANIALAVLGTAAMRLLVPVTGIAFAFELGERGWGLLNAWAPPFWLAALATLLTLDFSRYALHWLLHRVPALWRLHAVHHSDIDYDFTTALRFHPAEAVVTSAWILAVIAALGPPVEALIAIEGVFIACSIATHANIRLPATLDAALRRIVVTPDLHRIHHSVRIDESNANFGTILPWWDRLFGTYRGKPALTHEAMVIGLAGSRDAAALTLPYLLLYPFRAARAA